MDPWPIRLAPGDVLLYSGTGFFSTLIKVKTWSSISHVELVAEHGDVAYASRDGQGVGTYPLRSEGLTHILRPRFVLNMVAIRRFHHSCLGQKYDWLGLLRFFTLGQQSMDKQFCSEYVTRLLRVGDLEPFSEDYDADLVSPGMFLASPVLETVWRAQGEVQHGA